MIVDAKIEKGFCKNSGKPYVRIDIPITDNYNKVVFLDKVEFALFEATYNEK